VLQVVTQATPKRTSRGETENVGNVGVQAEGNLSNAEACEVET